MYLTPLTIPHSLFAFTDGLVLEVLFSHSSLCTWVHCVWLKRQHGVLTKFFQISPLQEMGVWFHSKSAFSKHVCTVCKRSFNNLGDFRIRLFSTNKEQSPMASVKQKSPCSVLLHGGDILIEVNTSVNHLSPWRKWPYLHWGKYLRESNISVKQWLWSELQLTFIGFNLYQQTD